METYNELALFAGIGGGILGSKLLGWRTIAAIEIKKYNRDVLIARQEDGCLPLFPIWDDIRTFNGRSFRGFVDIVTGGFPCQPYSNDGKRLGEKDARNLWPDTIRIIREVELSYCLLENVPNLLNYEYFGTIIGQLAESGYSIRYGIISAASVGANHRRKRLWIACNSTSTRQIRSNWKIQRQERRQKAQRLVAETNWWACEPRIQRVDDGTPDWVDRTEAIGNAQVPAVVRAAWLLL